jgi:ABC-type multidrug transport system fused ATPase/permease subunit
MHIGLAFWYSSRLIVAGEILGGNVLVVFFAMLIGAMSLMGIPPNVQAITTAQGAAWKVFHVIERVPVIDSLSPDGLKPDALQGHIEFRNCDFNYPTRPDVPVLKNMSLIIKPGQTVAFVGYVDTLTEHLYCMSNRL